MHFSLKSQGLFEKSLHFWRNFFKSASKFTIKMGLYWRRSTKILPGVRINWSKSGPSISMGPRGAKVNIGKRGTYVSGSIPGTGLYYRQKVGGGPKSSGTSNGRTYSTSTNTQPTFSFSKQGCLLSIVASIILSLLFSSNFITAALVAVIAGVCWFFMRRKNASAPQSNQNAPQPVQPTSAPMPNVPTSSQPFLSSDDIDVKVAVAEVELLISEIDNTTDKVKLPSIYRKLMSIVYKLEKNNGVEIQGVPIEIAKKRILENYRKRLNT